jgi:hypothetical protein
MKFKLEIELGNDAMQYANDVAGALENVARSLRSHDLTTFDELDPFDRKGTIRDENGNKVGKWEATESMTQETADFFNQKHAYGVVVNGVERDPADLFPPRQFNVNRLPYNPGPLYIQENHE